MPFVPLSQLTPLEMEWLMPGRLPLGHLAILDGDPEMGKSLITIDLAARITTGQPLPDGTAGSEPAAVLMISAEDGARDTIYARFRAAGGDPGRLFDF